MTANLLTPVKKEKKRYFMSAIALTTSKKLAFATLCCAVLMLVAAPAWAQASDQGICSGALVQSGDVPHLGSATGCGAVITVTAVNDSGKAIAFTVTPTGNGNPYDGTEDTLIGIVNNSTGQLNSITLSSTDTTFGGIFNFDQDGPCQFTGGDSNDCFGGATGYEGPNNTFNVTSPTSGTVNFTTSLSSSSCDGDCSSSSTWFALEGTPSSLVFVGDQKPVATGTIDLTPTGAPVNEKATFPANTIFGNVAFIQLTETPVDPDTFNAGRFPATSTNSFSGGSTVPASTKCTPINGSCVSLLIQCFDSSHLQIPCLGIVPPSGKLINLTSQFQTPSGIHNPAVLIASDFQNDWANITNFFDPGDVCLNPPCTGGGGTKGLNSESVLADLNLACQVLTYTLSPTSGPVGTSVNVKGSLKGCQFVSGEKTLFGALLASLTFRLTGPLSPPSCTVQTVVAPPFPLILPFNSTIPFNFQLKIPKNACKGQTTEVTSSILSGTVEYVNSATFTVTP